VGQLGYPPLLRNRHFLHDFMGVFLPNAMNILQRNNDALVGRNIHASDAGHGHSLLYPALAPAFVKSADAATDNATPSLIPRARHRWTSGLGCRLLMDSPALRQPPPAMLFRWSLLAGC